MVRIQVNCVQRKSGLRFISFYKNNNITKQKKVFTEIMRRLRFEYEKKWKNSPEEMADSSHPRYLPMDFGSMISYLSFCTSREEIQREINVLLTVINYHLKG